MSHGRANRRSELAQAEAEVLQLGNRQPAPKGGLSLVVIAFLILAPNCSKENISGTVNGTAPISPGTVAPVSTSRDVSSLAATTPTGTVGDLDDGQSAAIAAVRGARVETTHGQSSMTVKDAVAFYDSAYPNDPRASRSIGWRAEKLPSGNVIVSLDYWNSGKRDVAQWLYDPGKRSVKTANNLADTLSWVPAE